jgi:hypothetical protein
MTLVVAFRNFERAPKKDILFRHGSRHYDPLSDESPRYIPTAHNCNIFWNFYIQSPHGQVVIQDSYLLPTVLPSSSVMTIP